MYRSIFFYKFIFYIKKISLLKLWKIIDVFFGFFSENDTKKQSVFCANADSFCSFSKGRKSLVFMYLCFRIYRHHQPNIFDIPPSLDATILWSFRSRSHLPHFQHRKTQFLLSLQRFFPRLGRGGGWGKKVQNDAKKCLRRSSLFIDASQKNCHRLFVRETRTQKWFRWWAEWGWSRWCEGCF